MSDHTPLASIFTEALRKFELGSSKYGPFAPETDQRDLLLEAEGELLDAINYLGMFLLRIRSMRDTPPCCRPGCCPQEQPGSCHDTAGK